MKETIRYRFLSLLLILLFALLPGFLSAASTAAKDKPAARVDLNSATEKELVALPGVGEATAKKIIAGRPYKTVDDLAKAGISKTTITKLTPLVTVGATEPAAAPAAAPAKEKKATPAKPAAVPAGPVD